jgi:hypothetical protein
MVWLEKLMFRDHFSTSDYSAGLTGDSIVNRSTISLHACPKPPCYRLYFCDASHNPIFGTNLTIHPTEPLPRETSPSAKSAPSTPGLRGSGSFWT